jgi:hypothetical protein
MTACVFLASLSGSAFAQFKEADQGGMKLGEARVQHWRSGLVVDAVGGSCRGIVGYVPFPADWPEQDVKIVEEDVSHGVKVTYQTEEGTVKLMKVTIVSVPSGQQAKAIIGFEIRRSAILPPENTDGYVLPDPKKLGHDMQGYITPSPKIESHDAKIHTLARQIGTDKQKAWEKVEAIYDWVRETVQYKKGPMKGALATLSDKVGDCEGMTSLFIAVCRAADIPARTVWVPEHCYPEFYLLDEQGKGHWFPCQAAGSRCFGGIPELRPILQKGDNFRPPWNHREHQRFLAEYLTGGQSAGAGKPRVKFIRELVQEQNPPGGVVPAVAP